MKRPFTALRKLAGVMFVTLLTIVAVKAQHFDFAASLGTFTPVTGGTTVADIQADEAVSEIIPIGFTFNYFGTNYTELVASSNGFITFDLGAGSILSNEIPSYQSGKNIIAPLWDDLSGVGGTARYIVSGAQPSRIFTIQYLDWKWNYGASAAGISFQVKLYEGSNKIEFIYRQEAGALQNASASIGLQGISFNQFYCLPSSSSSPGLSVAGYNAIASKPASNQVYAFTPGVGPSAPTVQSSNIIISNQDGESATLSWSIGNGSYNAVFIKETSSTTDNFTPINGEYYYAFPDFGDYAADYGNGWYCVYNGTSTSVRVSELYSGVTYRVKVVEYNGLGGAQKYATGSAANNPKSFTSPLVAPVGDVTELTPYHIGSSSGVDFFMDKGDAHKVAIFVKKGTGEFAPVVNGVTYTADRKFGAGSQIGTTGWYCVYNDAGASGLEVTGLSWGTDYTIHAVNYNGASGSERYSTATEEGNNLIQFTAFGEVPVNTYTFAASTTTFTPIAGATAIDEIEDDEEFSNVIPIGFSFRLAGLPFTHLTASSNGFLSFNPYVSNAQEDQYDNLLEQGDRRPLIAPFWDDLTGEDIGQASYVTTGAAPNRVFTIQYLNWRSYQTTDAAVSFQVKLYETSNKVEFIYRKEAGALSASAGASIGMAFANYGANNFISLSDAMAAPTASTTVDNPYIDVVPATGQVYSFTPQKMYQAITFNTPAAMTVGEVAMLNATATSGLAITYSSTSDKVSISGSQVTYLKAGAVTIRAAQAGNTSFFAATPAEVTFCISPARPVITTSGLETETPVLTSSSPDGNQWFKEGIAINGATGKTLTVGQMGIYTVVVSAGGCTSVPSADLSLIVTDISEAPDAGIKVYPNPTASDLTVDVTALQLQGPATISLYDALGRTVTSVTGSGEIKLDLSTQKAGQYLIRIDGGNRTLSKKIVKK